MENVCEVCGQDGPIEVDENEYRCEACYSLEEDLWGFLLHPKGLEVMRKMVTPEECECRARNVALGEKATVEEKLLKALELLAEVREFLGPLILKRLRRKIPMGRSIS